MSLKQKTAIVTGATRGIGFAIANHFAREGAKTILVGREPARVASAEQQFVATYGPGHRGVVLDVSDKDQVDSTMKSLMKTQPVDVLVNAAGISRDGLLVRLQHQDLDVVMQTNLFGTIRMCHHVAKAMIRKKTGGCIINLSSVVGIHGNVGQTVYSASKAGVIGFTKSLAKELGPMAIRVNAIAPGFIETDMTAELLKQDEKRASLLQSISLRRFGHPNDVADAALFLALSSYVHGQVLRVDGGLVI